MSTGKSDFLLQGLYLFSNPFRICRRFFQQRGEKQIHAYGETPLALWADLALFANLTPHDVFCDLGCGRGRLCFWTYSHIGCHTIGIDWVPSFIRKARFLSQLLRPAPGRLLFLLARINEVPLEEVTVAYLYTFHPDEETLDFSRLPLGARVLSVSEPLDRPYFAIQAKKEVSFPWGDTEVFLNVKI